MLCLLKLLKNPERDKEKVAEKEVERRKEESVDKEREVVKPKDDRTKLRFSKENRERIREKRESNSREKEKAPVNDRAKSARERERDSKVKLRERINGNLESRGWTVIMFSYVNVWKFRNNLKWDSLYSNSFLTSFFFYFFFFFIGLFHKILNGMNKQYSIHVVPDNGWCTE